MWIYFIIVWLGIIRSLFRLKGLSSKPDKNEMAGAFVYIPNGLAKELRDQMGKWAVGTAQGLLRLLRLLR